MQSPRNWSPIDRISAVVWGATLLLSMGMLVQKDRSSEPTKDPSKPVSIIRTEPSTTAGLSTKAPFDPRTEMVPLSVAASGPSGTWPEVCGPFRNLQCVPGYAPKGLPKHPMPGSYGVDQYGHTWVFMDGVWTQFYDPKLPKPKFQPNPKWKWL